MVEISGNMGCTGPQAMNNTLPAAPQKAGESVPVIASPSDTFAQTMQAESKEVPHVFPEMERRSVGKMGSGFDDQYIPTTFKTVTLCQAQTYYTVTFPVGWKFMHKDSYVIIFNPREKNTCVSFLWTSGAGSMNPQGNIDSIVKYNNITDYQITGSKPQEETPTPPGITRKLEQDATFTYRNEKCHSNIISTVYESTDPVNQYWGGSMIWRQAPEKAWNKYDTTLYNIASSFKKIPTPKPKPEEDDCWHIHFPHHDHHDHHHHHCDEPEHDPDIICDNDCDNPNCVH